MVDPPIGHPQKWIAADVGLQRGEGRGKGGDEGGEGGERGEEGKGKEKGGEGGKKGRDLGGVRTTPVRAVEAGAFKMEVWVEEGRGKVELEEAERLGGGVGG
jgi:mitotic spindle assembly checkpoint protein MAD2B